MPEIDGKSYPRLENGVVLYAPPAEKSAPEPAPVGEDRINLNTATEAQLKSIKGIGKATSADIVAEREDGPFLSIQDCAERVGSVSLATLERAKVIV